MALTGQHLLLKWHPSLCLGMPHMCSKLSVYVDISSFCTGPQELLLQGQQAALLVFQSSIHHAGSSCAPSWQTVRRIA